MDNQKMLYSLKISIKELSNEILLILDNNRIEDKNSLYKKIGDVLHWIYDCIEKLLEEFKIARLSFIIAVQYYFRFAGRPGRKCRRARPERRKSCGF